MFTTMRNFKAILNNKHFTPETRKRIKKIKIIRNISLLLDYLNFIYLNFNNIHIINNAIILF